MFQYVEILFLKHWNLLSFVLVCKFAILWNIKIKLKVKSKWRTIWNLHWTYLQWLQSKVIIRILIFITSATSLHCFIHVCFSSVSNTARDLEWETDKKLSPSVRYWGLRNKDRNICEKVKLKKSSRKFIKLKQKLKFSKESYLKFF